MTIFLTGSTGFLGKNIINYFKNEFEIKIYKRNDRIIIQQDVIIHLAGKAHDLKNISDPKEYYDVNTELTKNLFDSFLISNASKFIFISSVKAVADKLNCELKEDFTPHPTTHYGKSKLLAENYILSKKLPKGKSVYILRPCMIHGPNNKGNLNLLLKLTEIGLPWPLSSFNNQRSFCSVENISFVIKELLTRNDIQSGIYNIADNDSLSTNDLIKLIGDTKKKKILFIPIPKYLISIFAKIGDLINFPLNTERLEKLTDSYVVNNSKLIAALGKDLPIKTKDGLITTINSIINS